jgi:hypothetical protein
MKILLTFIALIPSIIMAQEPPTVFQIEPVSNQEVRYEGNLNQGQKIEDLSWAWQSNNACFPATQYHKFTGNHVFFTGILPAYSESTVTVIPKDPEANFSLYAYEVGVNNDALPPNLASCIRCEADHKWDRSYAGKTQDHTRYVKYMVAITRPYRIVIGVVGAEELDEGDFTLVINTKGR